MSGALNANDSCPQSALHASALPYIMCFRHTKPGRGPKTRLPQAASPIVEKATEQPLTTPKDPARQCLTPADCMRRTQGCGIARSGEVGDCDRQKRPPRDVHRRRGVAENRTPWGADVLVKAEARHVTLLLCKPLCSIHMSKDSEGGAAQWVPRWRNGAAANKHGTGHRRDRSGELRMSTRHRPYRFVALAALAVPRWPLAGARLSVRGARAGTAPEAEDIDDVECNFQLSTAAHGRS